MIFSLILGATFLFSSTTEAADYDVTKIDAKGILYTRGASSARINKDGQLLYYTYYDLNKNDILKKVTYDENTTVVKKLFKRKSGCDYEVFKPVGDNKIWIVYQNYKNKSNYFVKYNDKGKVLTKIKLNIKDHLNFKIHDIMEDGNKIYCALIDTLQTDKDYIEILCINKKKGKIVSKKRFSIQYHCQMKFANDKIYAMNWNEITVYSLKGKQLATYQKPEGQTRKSEEHGVLDYTVKGNSIYYVNTLGLYKCDELGSKTFELIYDASNDDLFTKAEGNYKTVNELCVKDDNEFYLIFNNQAGYESYAPTAIARYKKKN